MGGFNPYPTVQMVLAAKALEPGKLLDDILCQLSAPEREFRIEQYLLNLCKKQKIPYRKDEQGNLWVNAKTEKQIEAAKIILVSHLDHPGIRIDSFHKEGEDLLAHGTWLGGGPLDIEGARVWVFGAGPKDMVPGKVLEASYQSDRPSKVTIKIMDDLPDHSGDWGACFAIPTQINATEIRTRSADDLISVCADFQALMNLGFPEGAVALLTHSEEINLEGTEKLLKKKIINPHTRILVVDTTEGSSRHLGKGIIIRAGDEEAEYSADQTQWLERTLRGIPQETKKTQGATEGTCFIEHGYAVGSLAVPVLHQHNVGWNQKPVEEVVALRDYEFLVQALEAAIRSVVSQQ
jgi:putative aminopeptidase FrvX